MPPPPRSTRTHASGLAGLRSVWVLPLLAACAAAPPAAPSCPDRAVEPPATESTQGRIPLDAVVATWNGGELTYRDLLALIGDEAESQRRRAVRARFALEQEGLRDLVARKLMAQAAAAEGKTLDAYVDELQRSITVSDEEVQAFFDAHLADEDAPIEALEGRIRDHLRNEKTAATIQRRIASLLARAGVSLQLTPPPEAIADLALDGRPSLGPADAPVTVVVFEDFECPFCADARHVVRQYHEAYPDRVRVVFMHYPLRMHPAAMDAAITAECAHRQGRFWDMYEAIFAQHDQLQPGAAAMRPFAESVGLDLARFDACVADPAAMAQVEADVAQGDEAGVEGTPSVFVNGVAMDGLPSPAQLSALLPRR